MFAGCCAGVAQLVEQLICNQQVGGSNPSTSSNFIDNMGDFPSGQRGQTVNLLAMPSVVRIHHPPPKSRLQKRSAFYFCAFHYSPPRKPLTLPHSLYPSVGADASVRPLRNYEIMPCRAAPMCAAAHGTINNPFVGADAYIGPTGFFRTRQGTRALPYKIAWCRAAPLVTDAGRRGRRPLR